MSRLHYYNPYDPVNITAHNLPHWTQDNSIYFVTFRLADSLPQDKLTAWKEEYDTWLRFNPQPWNEPQWQEYNDRFGKKLENWLDAGSGECHFRHPEMRTIIQDCLQKFDGQRYDLMDWVIMPNHIHALICPREGQTLSKILQGIKGVSAKQCNALLGRTGQTFWQEESYDHIVRSQAQLDHFIHYIHENPIKAKLQTGEYNVAPTILSGNENNQTETGLSRLHSETNSPQTGLSVLHSYTPFEGICLTDSFQLGEDDGSKDMFSEMFPQNSDRVKKQKKTPLRIIIGNPPYSVGQKSANDNAQNQSYTKLDSRIEETYVAGTESTNKNSLYDSYIKAFRWASDRLDPEHGGIIAFVTNAGWLDGNAMDGFRKCIEKEFSAIYVFNLRGNCRTQGELRKKEAGNVFGLGSRTPIAITILVKNPNQCSPQCSADNPVCESKQQTNVAPTILSGSPNDTETGLSRLHSVLHSAATIYYHDIGDYLNREEKLKILADLGSIANTPLDILTPNEHGDWLNHRNDVFETFIPIEAEKKFDLMSKSFFVVHSRGLATARDSWCYNSSKPTLLDSINKTLDFYNTQRKAYHKQAEKKAPLDFVSKSASKISWNRATLNDLAKNKEHTLSPTSFVESTYRPFFKQHLYFHRSLNEMVYQLPKLFPTPHHENLVIVTSGIAGSKEHSVLISNCIPDLHFNGDSQCFPLYYYEKVEDGNRTPSLFDKTEDEYIRRDGISDFILAQCRQEYGHKVSKEDIFYFVYGLLHSPEYKEIFASDLKKMLPRIPLVNTAEKFRAFSKAGRDLAKLHLEYECSTDNPVCGLSGSQCSADNPVSDVVFDTPTGLSGLHYQVEKMRFPSKSDKTTILYNSDITIRNIPAEAYEYVVNGKSAIEWVMERYQVTTNKDTGIKNNPNDWATEHAKPRYILDLLLSVISLSLATTKIVKNLPSIKEEITP